MNEAQEQWQATLDDVDDKIHWRFSLDKNDCRTMYRPENGYWLTITRKEARMEIRKILKYARANTITEIFEYLLEDEERLIDADLFLRSREKIVGFLNGVFDLQTGQLRHYQSDDWVVDPLPYVLPRDFDAKAEAWFVEDILTSWVGPETANWFCNLLAYLLFVYPNKEQKWVNLFGMGANGKSVCLRILEMALGPEKVIGADLQFVNRFSTDTFKDRWLIIGRDSGNYVSDNATAMIKNYSGDDTVLVEKKGGDSVDTTVSGKMVVSTNSLIMSADHSHGWFRRILPVPFPNEFEEDPDFEKNVLKKLPQIVRVLCHRAYLYKKNKTKLGKSMPKPVRDLVQETRFLNDRAAGFWELWFHEYEERQEYDEHNRPTRTVITRHELPDRIRQVHGRKMSEVYDLFKDWHKDEFGDMEIKPSLKTFGGPYGAFLQSPAGKLFEYRKTKIGRMVELKPGKRDKYLKAPGPNQADIDDFEEDNPF